MLEGIRIIDFTNYIPGPFATMRLAELGAEIIKVEPPQGDPSRNTGSSKGGIGLTFLAHNRQKQSISLDLKTKEGQETALALIKEADAVLESFRPGIMEKLGLGYEAASSVNPAIVYCSITGYGKESPLGNLGSHDLNHMAISGVLAQLKDQQGSPVHPSITLADYIGGLAASERILAGLVSRGMKGKGSYHCISIADAMISFMSNHVMFEKETGYPNGVALLNGKIVSYGLYQTQENRYMSIGALEPKFWRNFCQAVDRPEWLDAHFSPSEDDNPVYRELCELFASRSFKEWIAFGEEVDCCLAPVLEAGELSDFSYFKQREVVFDAPWGGRHVKMHGERLSKEMTPPPKKGEDAKAIKESLKLADLKS